MKLDQSVATSAGNAIGYVTVLGKGLTGFQQPVTNVKIVAICMNCAKKKK